MTTQVLNFLQWCRLNGYPTRYEVLSHVHSGLRSAQEVGAYARWYKDETARLQALVKEAEHLYDKAVDEGLVIDPESLLTRKERLIRTARGHPDNDAVQAARRLVLKKYNIVIE